jgi:hypothetical protein
MRSQNISLSKGQAIKLARRGGFSRNPSISASKQARGVFGESLVKGWLERQGYQLSDHVLVIRAEDFGLDVFPSIKRYRMVEIVTTDETLAVEVKTYSTHAIQGTNGDPLEEQLGDALRWRAQSARRTLALAIVNYFGKPVILKSNLHFIRANHIPILRFIIRGMTS